MTLGLGHEDPVARASYIMWGLVSKLCARALSWQLLISPAFFFRILTYGFEQCATKQIKSFLPGMQFVITVQVLGLSVGQHDGG